MTQQNYITAIYDIANPCNYRCVYCRNDWDVEENREFPPFEDVKRMLDTFAEYGFKRIIYTGGEFFIIPYWKEILEYASSLKFDNWVISNGYSIPINEVEFLEKHISRINVSFHAPTPNLYNEIMGTPADNCFSIAIKKLKTVSAGKIKVGIFYSPLRENYRLFYKTIETLHKKGVKICDVNLNRILPAKHNSEYLTKSKPLSIFEHKKLIEQLIAINKDLNITAYSEAYPVCFLNTFIADIKQIENINRPCIAGHKALAFNADGSLKLCPATGFKISKDVRDKSVAEILENETFKDFHSNKWQHEKCKQCKHFAICYGGCYSSAGELFSSDTLIPDDELTLKEGIDGAFFDALINLYKPFLSTSFKKAPLKYTVFSKKYPYPIGLLALNKTKSNARFFEIALIPQVKGNCYAFYAIQKFLQKHPLPKIGWTVHKANIPSILLLQKLHGGFMESTVRNKKRIEAEGFFRNGGEVPVSMKNALEELIPQAKIKFEQWEIEYQAREAEQNNLTNILESYENN
ncbi:MAG: radical SAM protein [Bacteroidales bacterium]|nr:radical SAM protein [Bacteroidales bacterium]